MVWDPPKIAVQYVVPPSMITTADVDVRIGLIGAGFDITLTGVFVLHVDPQKPPETGFSPADTIPCNWFKVTEGDYAATLRICPRRKTPGDYDLILWVDPPDAVYGEEQVPLPVNSVCIFPKAITVVDTKLGSIDEETERLKERLGRSANEGPLMRSPTDQPKENDTIVVSRRRISKPRDVP